MQKIFIVFSSLVIAWAQEPRKDVVVVTGNYEPVPLEEVDRNIRVLKVHGKPSLVSNTIIDFLNQDSSIDLRQRGPSNIQTDVSIRGGSFGQTLVLLNGLRINDVQSGHHNMDLPVTMEAIDRIEVLKGSGSTRYGSDAIGGVINIISKPPETNELRLRTAVGNFGVNEQRAIATLARKRWTEQVAFSREFSTGFRDDRDYRNLALSSATSLTSGVGLTSVLLGSVDKPFGADQFYGNFNSWERTRTWFAALQQSLGERMEASFAYRRHTDLFVLYRDRPDVSQNRHRSESYQANFRRWERLAQNAKLHYGVEGLHEGVRSTNLGVHDRSRASPYLALDLRALRRFSFTIGLREELYGALRSQLSPSVGAGVWLSQWLKIRGSASRAFRLPSYTDLFYRDPANLGSPNLKPEKAVSFDGGLDWNAAGKWNGEVTVFHRRDRDVIDYVRRTTAEVWRATNFQRLEFTGVEATATFRPNNIQQFTFSYTGMRGLQSALGGLLSKYAFNYPNHIGVAGWQVNFAGALIRTRFGAVQRFGRRPYGVLDVYAARTRGSIHPFIQLTNITDSVYQEIAGVAMPGRAAIIGLEISFFSK